MRREEIDSQLSALAFDFFYWFSRFEFALKENGYLKSHEPGQRAEPGWGDFVRTWHSQYVPSNDALTLLEIRPKVQIVGPGGSIDWALPYVPKGSSTLAEVVVMLKTVRNNLFHGGKHGEEGWDDPAKSRRLLEAGNRVLGQLAALANIGADFSRYY